MIRPYTTSEMIQELTKDKTRKFKRLHDGLEMSAPKGQLVWESGNDFLSITDDEWVEVDQSVDFITAVESEKKVRLEHKYLYEISQKVKRYYIKDKEHRTYDHIVCLQSMIDGNYQFFNRILYIMNLYMNTYEVREIILNAKWYLKEEN